MTEDCIVRCGHRFLMLIEYGTCPGVIDLGQHPQRRQAMRLLLKSASTVLFALSLALFVLSVLATSGGE